MTSNQIAYLKLNEDRQHNRASEATEARKAGAAERQASASEGQVRVGFGNLSEAIRHNQSQENLGWYDAQGRVTASLQQAQAALSQAETASQRKDIAQQEANIKAIQAQIDKRVAEENARHNAAMEQIQASGVDVKSRSLDEQILHNRNMEEIQRQENEARRGSTAVGAIGDAIRTAVQFVPFLLS